LSVKAGNDAINAVVNLFVQFGDQGFEVDNLGILQSQIVGHLDQLLFRQVQIA